jgi:hypothetical protein
MKTVVLCLMISLTTYPAVAGEYSLRESRGTDDNQFDVHAQSNCRSSSNCGYVVRDNSGRTTHTLKTDVLGNYSVRNPQGQTVGTIRQDVLGRAVIRDNSGKTIQSIE